MPSSKACVCQFTVGSTDGVSSILYTPRYQALICGYRSGQIAVLDMRQRTLLNVFDAHSRTVKELSFEPTQTFMLSGSSDGNALVRTAFS